SGEDPSTWHHDNGESHDHEAKPKGEAKESSRKTAISLSNVGIESETVGVGTHPSGNRVRFRLSPEDHASLKAILYSDMAINFSGVDISEDEVIKEGYRLASRKTSHMTREGVKFVLEINSEGDAMTGEANHELARILH